MHLEGTEYSLPVDWAMTGLFWTLIYGLINLPWWSNTGYNRKVSLIPCGHWASRGFTRSLFLHQGCWTQLVAKWNQKLGTYDESVSLKKKSHSFLSVVLGEWEHSILLTEQVALAWCLALSSAGVERAGSAARLLPEHEILSAVSEPQGNCWCRACGHAKLHAV